MRIGSLLCHTIDAILVETPDASTPEHFRHLNILNIQLFTIQSNLDKYVMTAVVEK